MSDDAQTPEARENAAALWPTPPGDAAAAPDAAVADAAEVPLAEGAESEVDLGKADPASGRGRGESLTGRTDSASGPADARPEPNPWAPPEDDTGPGPSVHDQPTVTSVPAMGTPPAAADANRAWANPVAPDPAQTQAPQPWANPFAPPADGTPNPFAPPARPAHGEPVPPPPMAPDGPGQVAYGYPAGPSYPAGYGYPAGPGYPTPADAVYPTGPGYQAGHGYPTPPGAGHYGWPGMHPAPANGMGTASLVLGICAAVVFCLWPLAIVLGILAVIFGVLGRGKARKGVATNAGHALAGIICGAVGIALGIGMIVLVFSL
jgi:hypothetical protein